MKKRILTLLSVVAIFAASCSKESNELTDQTIPKATVGISLEKPSNSLKASYKRGNAPVYISGVTIRAKSKAFSSPDVVKTFNFAASGGSNITMTTPIGENTFSAVGVCDNAKGNFYLSSITSASGSTTNIDTRAEAYATIVNAAQGVYADFRSSSVTKTITESSNNIALNLATSDSRLNFVSEVLASSTYKAKISIKTPGNIEIIKTPSYAPVGNSAIVLNDDEVNNQSYVNAYVYLYSKSTSKLIKTLKYRIDVPNGNITTYLFRLEKSTPYTASSTQNITFTPLTSSTAGSIVK